MKQQLYAQDWFIAVSQLEGIGRMTLERLVPLFLELPPQLPLESLPSLSSVPLSSQRKNIIRQLTPDQVRKGRDQLAENKIQAITVLDSSYPASLKEISDHPLVLYARGNLHCLQNHRIAVVGTRIPTNYGRQAAFRLGEALGRKGIAVVSGMAKGVDAEAHKGALFAEAPTIAVLGCGIDVVYPPQHRRLYDDIAGKGLVLSEHPPGTPPHATFFPKRNRVISGLSLGVVVVEAADKSGSLITADLALEQGREVFAIPGSIFSPQSIGPNRLIRDGGAKLVTRIDDITNEFQYLNFGQEKDNISKFGKLTVNERQVLDIIENTQMSIDQLAAKTSLPVQDVLTAIFSLQLQGRIRQLPGGYCVKV